MSARFGFCLTSNITTLTNFCRIVYSFHKCRLGSLESPALFNCLGTSISQVFFPVLLYMTIRNEVISMQNYTTYTQLPIYSFSINSMIQRVFDLHHYFNKQICLFFVKKMLYIYHHFREKKNSRKFCQVITQWFLEFVYVSKVLLPQMSLTFFRGGG